MSTFAFYPKQLAHCIAKAVSSMVRDRRGVAAVELAMVAPLLLVLYFMTMEVTLALETNKKVSRISSMVADLVTQQTCVNPTKLDNIIDIGQATIYPYDRTVPSIEITGIKISDETNPKATVDWSRKSVNNTSSAGAPIGSEVSIPAALKIRGTYLVRVQTSLDYRPIIAWAADEKASLGLMSAFDNIPMAETYYLRGRLSSEVKWDTSTCPSA